MRLRTGIAVVLLVALGLAGCGGQGPEEKVATAGGPASAGATPGSSPTKDAYEAMLDHVKCMREQGVDMPDPERDGEGISMMVPEGTPKEKVDAAMEKCRKYLPNGGAPPKANPEALEKARQMSKCMREHGLPDFPDPDENGGIRINGDSGLDPNDPKFKEAEKACGMHGGTKKLSEKEGGE